MSNLPRPSSRLPTPRTTSTEAKRTRGSSTDLEQGLDSKKLRFDNTTTPSTTNLNKSKSQSMLSLSKARLGRTVPTTGRTSLMTRQSTKTPSTVVGRMENKRTGLNDRTNADVMKPPPKWDLKGRLEIMEKKFSNTQHRIDHLEKLNDQLKSNVQEKETVVSLNTEELSSVKIERDRLNGELEAAKTELKNVQQRNEEVENQLKRKIQDLEFQVQSQDRKVTTLNDELEAKMKEISGLKSSMAELTSASAGIEAKLKCVEMQYTNAKDEIVRLNQLVKEQKANIEMYEEKSRNYETERRKLHNLVQELKGNIRVFCRLRPLLGDEVSQNGGHIRHIDIKEDNKSLEIIKSPDSPHDHNGGLKAKNKKNEFEFDKVFGPEVSQAIVFDEICQLVQSAIDGYNVCVFAYGQTGSGKTYTMEGGDSREQEGMIPRTIRQIFEETNRLVEKGWTYKLEGSFLEIYNEEIRDLLATEKNLKYEIKMSDASKKGEIYVTNAKCEVVTSEEQINSLLKLSRKNRAVAATNCNERSSRSHSVFIMKISGSNEITGETCQGSLNLVDLAGSERLKDSGSEGARLKETQNINRSLANLSNVIMALAQKESHVPFRNSKLTHLLQNSLGGNSKTLMFVNISPNEEYYNETLNSLRFATTVNQCQIGTATKRIK